MTDSYTGADPFGNPGTTELPIMNALSKSDIEYVLGIQEDVTTSMAAGYASICRYHAVAPDIRPAGVANLYVMPELARPFLPGDRPGPGGLKWRSAAWRRRRGPRERRSLVIYSRAAEPPVHMVRGTR